MKFTTYQFENNGDMFGFDEDSVQHYIGRCDSEGDISIDLQIEVEMTHEEIIAHVAEVLEETVHRSLAGDIDWTPDECWVKAAGLGGRYTWDSSLSCWVEAE